MPTLRVACTCASSRVVAPIALAAINQLPIVVASCASRSLSTQTLPRLAFRPTMRQASLFAHHVPNSINWNQKQYTSTPLSRDVHLPITRAKCLVEPSYRTPRPGIPSTLSRQLRRYHEGNIRLTKMSTQKRWAIKEFEGQLKDRLAGDEMLAWRIAECVGEGADRRQLADLTGRMKVINYPEAESDKGSASLLVLALIAIGIMGFIIYVKDQDYKWMNKRREAAERNWDDLQKWYDDIMFKGSSS